MYMAWTSAHSDACKRGLIQEELIRYLTLCTSETRFDKAWARFKNAFKSKGYKESFIEAKQSGLKLGKGGFRQAQEGQGLRQNVHSHSSEA